MSEWKTYTLGEVCDNIAYGYTESANTEIVGPKFLRITDIQYDFISWEKVPYCPITKDNHKKYKLGLGDIVIARTGASTGATAIFKDENIDAVFASYLIRYKINKQVAYPFYIGQLLKSALWKSYVASIIGGSAQPGANAKQFADFEFQLPDLATQTAIAQILTSLDDKIELNLQMNKTLEAMAQAIFKEWFVEFKFPNFDGELVDGLPKGWRKLNLSDLVETVSKTFKFPNGKAIFLNTSDILEGKFLHTNYTVYENLPGQAKKSIQKGDILFSEIRPANKRYAFVDFDAKDYVVSTKLMVLRSKGIVDNLLVYFFMKSDEVLNQLQMLAETRSGTFPQITYFELSKISINIPTEDILEKFTSLLKSSFEKIRENQLQIQSLTATRDTLLPKLMNGKIEIKN